MFIICFISFWYIVSAYWFIKRETRRILYGLDMSDKADALYYLRRKGDVGYNKDNKLSKKILNLIVTYFVAILPLIGLIIFLYEYFE